MSIAYNPEQYGLETVGEVEWTDESYSFDVTVVFRSLEGDLYWADDSGCSCPGLLEGWTFDQLTKGTKWELAAHLKDERKRRTTQYEWSRIGPNTDAEIADLMERVMAK